MGAASRVFDVLRQRGARVKKSSATTMRRTLSLRQTGCPAPSLNRREWSNDTTQAEFADAICCLHPITILIGPTTTCPRASRGLARWTLQAARSNCGSRAVRSVPPRHRRPYRRRLKRATGRLNRRLAQPYAICCAAIQVRVQMWAAAVEMRQRPSRAKGDGAWRSRRAPGQDQRGASCADIVKVSCEAEK